MMHALTRRSIATLTCLLVVTGFVASGTLLPRAVTGQPSAGIPAGAAAVAFLKGTGSCDAGNCHGSFATRDKALIWQRESTIWNEKDRHARAYRILCDDNIKNDPIQQRSKRIIDNLAGGGGWPNKANEEPRCLVCHANPILASADPKTTPGVEDERRSGVGCETCHGSADNWIKPHIDAKNWREKLKPEEKAKLGMFPVGDLVQRAMMCAGCHVGSPPVEIEGHKVLSRDVNHDLIAAGHPRLNFELDQFTMVTPHHWSLVRDASRSPDTNMKNWFAGQLVTAHAAAKLLEHRASNDKAPWPEFTEYDCFACHHSFRDPSWRQERGYKPRMPGSLPWGSWNFVMLFKPGVASKDGFSGDVMDKVDALRQEMSKPAPSRDQVKEAAASVARSVHDNVAKMPESFSRAQIRDLMRMIAGSAGQDVAAGSWDGAAQVSLALSALDEAYRRVLRKENADTSQANRVHDLVQKLANDLEFPKEYDSPHLKSFEPFSREPGKYPKDPQKSGPVYQRLKAIEEALGS